MGGNASTLVDLTGLEPVTSFHLRKALSLKTTELQTAKIDEIKIKNPLWWTGLVSVWTGNFAE